MTSIFERPAFDHQDRRERRPGERSVRSKRATWSGGIPTPNDALRSSIFSPYRPTLEEIMGEQQPPPSDHCDDQKQIPSAAPSNGNGGGGRRVQSVMIEGFSLEESTIVAAQAKERQTLSPISALLLKTEF